MKLDAIFELDDAGSLMAGCSWFVRLQIFEIHKFLLSNYYVSTTNAFLQRGEAWGLLRCADFNYCKLKLNFSEVYPVFSCLDWQKTAEDGLVIVDDERNALNNKIFHEVDFFLSASWFLQNSMTWQYFENFIRHYQNASLVQIPLFSTAFLFKMVKTRWKIEVFHDTSKISRLPCSNAEFTWC